MSLLLFFNQPTGGPSTYNETHTASVAVSDSLTSAATFPNATSESAATDFTLGSAATFPNTISESIALAFTASDSLGPITYNETHAADVTAGFSFAEYDPATRLLLKFNEANGSTAPVDTSSYGWLRTVTTGTGAVSSAQGVFGSNSVAVGNPTGAKDIAAFTHVSGVNDLFASDGSVGKQFDIWFRPINNGNSHTFFSVGLNNGDRLILSYSPNVTEAYYSDTAVTTGIYAYCSFSGFVAANQWAHYRVSIIGDTLRLGKDGVDKASVTLGQNVWRGEVRAGTPPLPSEVRIGRYPSAYDGNPSYDFLVAQGYADAFVITEGAGAWAGGAYAVPTREPEGTWYRQSDNFIGMYNAAFDVGVGTAFSNISNYVDTYSASVALTGSCTSTGGTGAYNETHSASVALTVSLEATGGIVVYFDDLAFDVGAVCSFASTVTTLNTVAEAVALAASLGARATYVDTHSGSVVAGSALAVGAIYRHVLSASITAGASYLAKQFFVESLHEAVLLAQSFSSAQVLVAATSDSVTLATKFYTFDSDGVYEHVHIYDESNKVYSQYMRQITETEYLEIEVVSAYEVVK